MVELKTLKSDASIHDFINSVQDERKRSDSFELLKIFEVCTGEKAAMWGTSIIGFGSYHYKSERSRQEGDWPRTGFSPRKQGITIYIMPGFDDYKNQLSQIGKHKISISCLYIKKLSDINVEILKEMITDSYKRMGSLNY